MDKIFFVWIAIITFSVVIAIVLLFLFVGKEAVNLFLDEYILQYVHVSEFFSPNENSGVLSYLWNPNATKPQFNILPLMLGSLKVAVIAILFAGPFGVFAAIFTSQFAHKKLRGIIKLLLEFFAAIPSVVLGFFALMVLCDVVQDLFFLSYRLNALVAGVTLGIMIVPIVFMFSEEVLSSVPRSYVEASFSLGASLDTTILRVILPVAFPGIFASLILAFSRALGETMIVLMVGGGAALFTLDPSVPTSSMAVAVAMGIGEAVFGGPYYTVLFFVGVILLGFSFVLNYVASMLMVFYKRRFG